MTDKLPKNKLHPKIFDRHVKKSSIRDGFGEQLETLGETHKNLIVLTADLKESTRVHHFSDKFPERFIDVGVAEQNMAGIAAGLALSGKVALMTSYGVFSPGRNWEQIRLSICYSQANVKIISSDAGIATGPDGATHMALEDIAITRVLPNITVLSPCDYNQTKKALNAAIEHNGPVYMRICREKHPPITKENESFDLGKADILFEGKDATLIATGPILWEAARATKQLFEEQGLRVELINIHTIKPIDTQAIVKSVKKTGKVITLEDHQVIGGLGSAVAEVLSQNHPVPLKIIGVKDTFAESGDYESLKKKYGLTAHDVKKAILELLD